MKFLSGSLPLSIAFLFLSHTLAAAQDLDHVRISGRVIDSSGAVIPGAGVNVTASRTGAGRESATNSRGEFIFLGLQPGAYEISAGAAGFTTEKKQITALYAGEAARITLRLFPAGIRAETTVSVSRGDAPVVDLKRTVNGATINERNVTELPNTSDDPLDLVYILGGVVAEPFSIRDLAGDDRIGNGTSGDEPGEVTGAGSVSLSGGAAFSTNFTIDGLDNNDDRSADARSQPPTDSVAEIQVITNQFSSEYGRASGGRINIRTKSGGESVKGSAFLHFEDEALNANTYNNNRRGIGRLPYTEYNAGVSISGRFPGMLRLGRSFYYTAFSFRDRDANTLIDTALPVDTNPRYPLPAPNHPQTARVDDVPDPGSDTFLPVDIATHREMIRTPKRRYRYVLKVNHHFSDKHGASFSFRQNRSVNFRQYRETTRFLRETLQGKTRRSRSISATDNFVISSFAVNQFRFQFSDYRPEFAAEGATDPVVLLFISDDGRTGMEDRVRGTVVIGNSTANLASVRRESRLQLQDTVTLSAGRHTLRIGADAQQIRSRYADLKDSTGTYNFARVYDLLTDQPSRYRRSFGAESILVNTYTGFFFQNDWNPVEGLTLAFGLRYDNESLVSDRNNFGPRFSVAFSPGKGGRNVLRFGFGVFYNRVLLRTLDDYTKGARKTEFDSELLAGPSNERRCLDQVSPIHSDTEKCRFLAALRSRFPSAPGLDEIRMILADLGIDNGTGFRTGTRFSRRVARGVHVPESYQLSVGYQREIFSGTSVEASLTFNKTVRLWRETNINAYRVPEGFLTLTDYLISLGTIDLRGRPTRFVLGDPADSVGVDSNGGFRTVNLATNNSSEASNSPIGLAFAALSATLSRPVDDRLGQIEEVDSIGQSVYEGLSISVIRRMAPAALGLGAAFRISYDLSRTRDDGFVDTSSALVAGDFRQEFSASGTDRRHKFRFSGTFEIPRRLGRLRLSPLVRIESARPFNISIGGKDRNLDDVRNDRPDFGGSIGDIVSRNPGEEFPQALADAFSLPPIGTPGNLQRNAGRGPALFIFDLSVSRSFSISDRLTLKPSAVIGNVLNARVFSFGSDFIDLASRGRGEFRQGFLVPSRTLKQRKVQLRLKLRF